MEKNLSVEVQNEEEKKYFSVQSFESFKSEVAKYFDLDVQSFVLKYVDDENDLITAETIEDFAEAQRVSPKGLKLFLKPDKKDARKDVDGKTLRHVTLADGIEVPAGSKLEKIWRVKNTGKLPWPAECSLNRVSNQSAACGYVAEAVKPGKTVDVSVMIEIPTTGECFKDSWRLKTPGGIVFGDSLDVSLKIRSN